MNTKSLVLPLVILFGCAPVVQREIHTIDTSCNLCIVQGDINGKKTYFLMDTGAGITTLDINQSKYFGFTSTASDLKVGAFNNSIVAIQQAIGIDSIRINKMNITGDIIYTMNMHNLVKHVEVCARKRISGVIGVPTMKQYRLVIDLTNNKLYRN